MDTWIDASTQAMEAYVKSAGSMGAVVFRFKERGQAYAAYVMPDAQNYIGAVAFPSSLEAQEWAETKLSNITEAPLEERAVGE